MDAFHIANIQAGADSGVQVDPLVGPLGTAALRVLLRLAGIAAGTGNPDKRAFLTNTLREFSVGFSVGLASCAIYLFLYLFSETPRQSKLYMIHNLDDSYDDLAKPNVQTYLIFTTN